jgi:glycogen debranching enzyme
MKSNRIVTTGSNTLVLNNADSFGVFDLCGNIEMEDNPSLGLYHRDTRFVNRLLLLIDNQVPVRLSSNIQERNEMMEVDLSNPARWKEESVALPEEVIHFKCESFLLEGAYYEKISISNFGPEKYRLSLSFHFDSDFKDIFEIRGKSRSKQGKHFAPKEVESGLFHLRYEGLDGIGRCSEFRFEPSPQKTGEKQVTYELDLDVQERKEIFLSIFFQIGNQDPMIMRFQEAFNRIQAEWQEVYKLSANIRSSDELFNKWINRSLVDLESLTSQTGEGVYPFAGVPWFNTIFGRDGIITAYEALWTAPYLGQGVLKVLAKLQAKALDPGKDAEPGKILHETRSGEMSETSEVPFKDYYGSVDSTLLYIMLAGEYYRRTADLDTIKAIWRNILAGLEWMDNYGDISGGGFIEYIHKSENGLINQGWKDSTDSISHADGRLAEPPIALCEIQGYAYAARYQAAILAEALGKDELAQKLREKARVLMLVYRNCR